MINANELRLGNWLTENVLGNCKVTSIWEQGTGVSVNNGSDEDYSIQSENVNPIPLTPEILIACGFKKDPDDCLSLNKIFYWLGFIQIAIGYAPLINLQHLKYLHQLQNLYFSFYNKELEYKP